MLAIRMLKQGAQPEAMRTLVEEKYWIPDRGIYADEMSALINSCSRLGREGLGVSLALGDGGALREAEVLRDDYFRQIIGYLHELEKGMFTKRRVQFFYCPEPTLAGAVAGIGMQYYFNGGMPSLGFSVLEKTTKVSSRGNRQLVARGLDLSSAMNEAAAEVGGQGGGHNIAAGATIPKGKEEKFISLVDDIVDRQLKVKAEA
jgi:RecJ-like exonuclease